jgi:ribosomal protein S18 acetylase RimI-like enzyme
MRVDRLSAGDLSLVGEIDRSEPVELEYRVVGGALTEAPVKMAEIPGWDAAGVGPHSVSEQIGFLAPLLERGAILLGAVEDERVVGLAVVEPEFEPGLAWLAFLHVSRPYRRRGAADALWSVAVDHARAADAQSLYVSATPTGSAIGFYLRHGCKLAEPVHPALYEHEPEDIHLVCPLQ